MVAPMVETQRAIRLRAVLLWCTALVVAFIAGVWLFFPAAALEHWAQRRLSVALARPVILRGLAVEFPATVRVASVTVGDGVGAAQALTLRPQWLRLLSGHAALAARAQVNGGVVECRAEYGGPLRLNAYAVRIHLPLKRLELPGGGVVVDAVVAQLEAVAERPALSALHHLHLVAAQVEARGAFSPERPLRLGRLELSVRRRHGGNWSVKLTSSGGDYRINADGSLVLKDDPAASLVNISGKIAAASATGAGYRFHITGVLLHPRVGLDGCN